MTPLSVSTGRKLRSDIKYGDLRDDINSLHPFLFSIRPAQYYVPHFSSPGSIQTQNSSAILPYRQVPFNTWVKWSPLKRSALCELSALPSYNAFSMFSGEKHGVTLNVLARVHSATLHQCDTLPPCHKYYTTILLAISYDLNHRPPVS